MAENGLGKPASTPWPSWKMFDALPCISSGARLTTPPNASVMAWWPRHTPRIRIGHDACPGLNVGHAVFGHQRPDRDRRFEIAVPIEEADCAAVRPALVGFQVGDDLHRANLRCSGEGAGGEARAQRVDRPQPL